MLRTRLSLGLLPLLLLVIGMGAYAIFVCHRLATSFQHDLLTSYEASLASERMRAAASHMDGASAAAARGDLAAAHRDFEDGRDAFRRELMDQSARSAGSPRAPAVVALDAAFQDFSNREEQTLAAGGPGALEAIQADEDAFYRVSQALAALDDYDYKAAQATEAGARRLGSTTMRVLLGAIGGAVLLALFVAWHLAASLLGPIQALTASAAALGDGDLERPVPEVSRDELGQLARTFNAMAAKLRAYREATAAKVLRAQRTMEATLISTPDPLFILGRDGSREVLNPAAQTLAAAPALAEGFPESLQRSLDRVLATGEHFIPAGYDDVVTLRIGAEDRHYLPRILAIGDPLTDFGGAAVLLQDVTRFRLLDDAKNNLVGTVSHELKTPLTSLRLAVYLLLERQIGPLVPAQLELLETARDDADRLLRILNDLLDLARLESGVAQLHRAEVPVASLLQEMAREIRPIVEARRQRVEISASPRLDAVAVDPERIRHVFINLLGNASKYSPEGGAIVLYAEPADDGFVRCGVRDRGPGIPPASLGRIFEKFYRLPGQKARGAGLGLAIAREIVVAHGGSIACSNLPGGGSDFYFHLPGNSSLPPATLG